MTLKCRSLYLTAFTSTITAITRLLRLYYASLYSVVYLNQVPPLCSQFQQPFENILPEAHISRKLLPVCLPNGFYFWAALPKLVSNIYFVESSLKLRISPSAASADERLCDLRSFIIRVITPCSIAGKRTKVRFEGSYVLSGDLCAGRQLDLRDTIDKSVETAGKIERREV